MLSCWTSPTWELDAINHGPDWTALPADDMRLRLDIVCPADGAWVADGNYESKGGDLVRARADTVVWLDFSRRTVMRQLAWRTARRGVLRERLWNGNRESLRNALSRDPERSVLLWSWTRYEAQRHRYAAQRDSRWVCLTNRAEVTQYLATLQARPRAAHQPAGSG